MPDENAKTTIRNKYAQQYASDLEDNRARQAELAQMLEQLKQDEAWLLRQLSDLPTSVTAADATVENEPPASARQHTDPAETAASVPLPRQDGPAKAAASKSTAKKSAAAKVRGTAKKPSAETKKAAAKSAARRGPAKKSAVSSEPSAKAASAKAGPPLHELVLGILHKAPGEPRMAREVADLLVQDHPDRAASVQTVRNALENLVKKNRAERSRQQGSVMYTAYAEAGAEVSTEHRAGDAAEQAFETRPDKAPAEV